MPEISNDWPTWVLVLLVIVNIFKTPIISYLDSFRASAERNEKLAESNQIEVVNLLRQQIAFSNALYHDLQTSIDKNTTAITYLTAAISHLVIKNGGDEIELPKELV